MKMYGKSIFYFSILISLLEEINCKSTVGKELHKEIIDKVPNIITSKYNINGKVLEQIKNLISEGDTIVELGSGAGTQLLTSLYNVYSIEHNRKWVNKVNKSHYIYAPLKKYNITEFPNQTLWYDVDIFKANLPKKYDLILVDGPTWVSGRGGFYKFINIFDTTVPIIIDDVNRYDERKLAKMVSQLLNRPLNITKYYGKAFGVIS